MPFYLPGCKIVGLDIGVHAIKAVQIKSSLKGFAITRFAVRPHRIKTWGDLVEELTALIKQEGIKGDIYVTSLPSHRALFRTTELPFTQLAKIEAAIRFEAESLMAIPLEGMAVDFALLEKKEGGSRVLVVCTPADLLQEYLDSLIAAGIYPDVVDIDSLALATLMAQLKQKGTIALLDIGAEKASLGVYKDGVLTFTRSLPLDNVSDKAGVKKLKPLLDEVTYSIKAYGEGAVTIDELWLIGGRSKVAGINEYLAEALRIPVRTPELIKGIPSHIPLTEQMYCCGAVALGLALRGLQMNKEGVNLVTKALKPPPKITPVLRRRLVGVGLAVIIFFVVLGVNFFFELFAKEHKYKVLKEGIARVFRESFPGGKGGGGELTQAQAMVKAMGEWGLKAKTNGMRSTLTIIYEVATLLPEGVKITELEIDEGRVSMRGFASSFAVVDQVKNIFSSSPYYKDVTVGNVQVASRGGGAVTFQLVFTHK